MPKRLQRMVEVLVERDRSGRRFSKFFPTRSHTSHRGTIIPDLAREGVSQGKLPITIEVGWICSMASSLATVLARSAEGWICERL
jgi:hypothetical protein